MAFCQILRSARPPDAPAARCARIRGGDHAPAQSGRGAQGLGAAQDAARQGASIRHTPAPLGDWPLRLRSQSWGLSAVAKGPHFRLAVAARADLLWPACAAATIAVALVHRILRHGAGPGHLHGDDAATSLPATAHARAAGSGRLACARHDGLSARFAHPHQHRAFTRVQPRCARACTWWVQPRRRHGVPNNGRCDGREWRRGSGSAGFARGRYAFGCGRRWQQRRGVGGAER